MPARRARAAEPQAGQETTESPAGERRTELQQAQEKFARMEEINMPCFKHRTDCTKLAEDMPALKYGESEIDYLLKPTGSNNWPSYAGA